MAKLAPSHLLQTSLSSKPTSLPRLSSTLTLLDDLGQLGELKTLSSVKAVHAQMIKMSNNNKMDIKAKSLATCYLEFGDSRSAAMAFFVGSAHYLPWSSFLEEFRRYGNDPEDVLKFFLEFHNGGVVFDSGVLGFVLKLCGNLKDLWLGLEMHAYLIKKGFDLDVYLNCALINFYGTCLGIESSNQLFDEMHKKEDMLWDEVIKLNSKKGRWVKVVELFRNMQLSFAKPNSATIINALQACGKVRALYEGKQIHGYVLRWELESNLSICNSLITMYSRNGRLELAKAAFDSMNDHNLSSWNSIISSYTALGCLNDAWIVYYEMELSDVKPDIVTWNCLLSGHSLHGSYQEALAILKRMQDAGFKPNSSSITSVLQAVSELCLLKHGKEIHGFVIRNGLDYDVYVGTSLVDMYVKNNRLSFAQSVFDNMKNKNIFAWNSLISGYSFKGLFEDAEQLLNSMSQQGIKPDLVTWNGLISGYAMKGRHKEAIVAIHRMKSSGLTPNVVSWTALISGCSQNENHAETLKYFLQMQEDGIRANFATISSLLKACAGLSLLRKGEEIHCHSIRKGFVEDVFVATALVDMYSKAGNFRSAYEVFRMIKNRTLASWNCMIMGFATYGSAKEAISLFNEMRGAGLQPDAITFTALLSGCKNSGLVDEGWKFFDSMSTDYNIAPTIEHFSCMVDILARAGYLDEAWDFIQTMPLKPDASIWGAFLASCLTHKNLEFAETAAKNLFELEPHNPANYVLMMNLYSLSNRWADVERLKDLMRKVGVKHSPVWSWTQIDQKIHMFCAEGKPHPDLGEIYFELYHLVSEMKKLGYEPDISCVHQNIDAVEKKKMLLSHTEKLAITYGLMKLKNGEPIRVVNNTRVCSDCHTAAKYMSVVRKCEIFLKDGTRFHHFREGKCTCNDCW
ncbi:pentatricopeptide repeat-containing protein At4g01030, mitochondrial [Rosa rugosa]|uniref:pentatricopeptide repeat-containing protein At4g01030, mitochondrial n=1 Tax=Rosa rugosa TaxID=74645 RepID=UPI002B417E1E|nr:pentatricopeptide repeat-containing protein At4g01030, mitochondrial [Rosa rugosa]